MAGAEQRRWEAFARAVFPRGDSFFGKGLFFYAKKGFHKPRGHCVRATRVALLGVVRHLVAIDQCVDGIAFDRLCDVASVCLRDGALPVRQEAAHASAILFRVFPGAEATENIFRDLVGSEHGRRGMVGMPRVRGGRVFVDEAGWPPPPPSAAAAAAAAARKKAAAKRAKEHRKSKGKSKKKAKRGPVPQSDSQVRAMVKRAMKGEGAERAESDEDFMDDGDDGSDSDEGGGGAGAGAGRGAGAGGSDGDDGDGDEDAHVFDDVDFPAPRLGDARGGGDSDDSDESEDSFDDEDGDDAAGDEDARNAADGAEANEQTALLALAEAARHCPRLAPRVPVEILQNPFPDRNGAACAQLRPGSSFLRSAPRFS